MDGTVGQTKNTIFDFSGLTAAERIQLAEDLWDSVAPETREVSLTPAQEAELDWRLEDLERNPGSGEPWEDVRARLHDRSRQGE